MKNHVSREVLLEFLKALEKMKGFPRLINGKINGLKHSEVSLIFLIGELREKNRKVFASDLSSVLLVSRAAVTPTIQFLEKHGFLRRETENSDARKAALYLTEKGEQALQAAKDYHYRFFSQFAESIGMERVVDLTQLLNLFYEFFSAELNTKENVTFRGKNCSC